MQSFAQAPRRGARRLCWLASTALTSVLLPLSFLPAAAQQTASPDVELREVQVTPPPARQPAARPSTPATSSAPRTTSAPTAANDPVVVSPTAIATPADKVASSVTVITSQQIEQQQLRSVPDALNSVPGLNVVQIGGPGGQTSVFMRGTASGHVKVIIDGIDATDPSTPNNAFQFGHLLANDIERIEVLRGPQSGLYGSDAIGGVISVITKKGEGPPKVTSTIEAGSFGTLNETASLSGSDKTFNYSFNVGHLHAGSVPVTPLELLPPGRRRNNDYYDNWSYSTKLGADVSENLSFNFVSRYTDAIGRFTTDEFDFTTLRSIPRAEQSTRLAHEFFTRGESVVSLFEDRFRSTFGAAYTNHWSWNLDPGALPQVFEGDRARYDYRGVITPLPSQKLIFGVERYDEHARTNTGRNVYTGDTGGYAEIQSEFQERFFLVANGRLDDNDSFGQHTTYRVAPAVLVPYSETKLKASYGTGFKAPTLFQLFGNSGTFIPNPNLKPETSAGYDYGFEQPVYNNMARFGVTWFHNDIKDLIASIFNPDFTSTVANADKTITEGYEAFGAITLSERLKLRADYTFTRVNSTDEFATLRRPRHKLALSSVWMPIDPLTLTSTVIFINGWRDIERPTFNFIDQRGFTIVNVAANYMINPNLTAFGRIDNLFDVRYQDPNGFLQRGLGVYVGMKLANR